MKDKEKTELILEALLKSETSWGKARSHVIFPELRLGSGYCGVAQRRIDLFVIDSGAGNTTTSYEIKVSRQDFKHDIENDLKQRGARLYSNYFYYVTPKGLLKPEEIPVWAGLYEIDLDEYVSDKSFQRFREVVPSPLHAKAMPSWGLICSMVRHVNKDCGKGTIEELKDENKKLKRELTNVTSILKTVVNEGVDNVNTWVLAPYKK